jgi:hypothetical protein
MDQPDHHFFVSYAWVDDQPFADPGPGDTHRLGWVSNFLDRFGKHLGRALGRVAEGERYWIDYQEMRGGEVLGETIRAILAGAPLLMPVLSRGWFASHWCRQELSTFLELHPDANRRGSERIFPVCMEPVERADLPTEAQGAWDQLREVVACDFSYRDADHQVRTRWFPAPDPTDRDYARLQQDLARRMAKRIQALQAAEAQPWPGTEAPSPEVPTTPPGRHLVLVNGGSADAGLVRTLADCLDRHGLGYVIPLTAQEGRDAPLKPSVLRQDLRDNLDLCTAVLMLYREGPPEQVHEQVREYLKWSARRPKDKPAPALDLCHAGPRPLSFRPPEMRVHPIGDDGCGCTDACIQAFIARLNAQSAQGSAP